MKTSFIQFLLIFSVSFLVIFSTNIGPRRKNGLIFYGLQRSHRLFYLFYCSLVLCNITNVPSDLPALLPSKTFPGINEDFYTCILGFFVDVPSVRRSLMILFLVDLLRNLKEKKLLYTCNQISPMFSADILLH